MALGEEVLGTCPPVTVKETDFQGGETTTWRSLGFQYSVKASHLSGLDPERPGMGNMLSPKSGGKNKDAKLNLMWKFCSGLTSAQQASRVYFGTSTGPGSINISAFAARATGVAPLFIFFDATGTTSGGTSDPFHELFYLWDFNDPSAGNWQDTKGGTVTMSKNRAFGAVAAHVFETPGTYNVRLDVYNALGEHAFTNIEIVVSDPEVVFGSANTIVVSATGDFTGAPAGTQVTSSVFNTIVNTHLLAGRRVLLKRGENYTSSASAVFNRNGPWHLGTWGSGVRPTVTAGGSLQGICTFSGSATPTIADGRVVDMDFDAANLGTTFYGAGTIDQLLLLRCRSRNTNQPYWFHGDTLASVNGGLTVDGPHYPWDQFGIVECEHTGQTTTTYISPQRFAYLGCIGSSNGGAPHVLRFPFLFKGVISNNVLDRQNSTDPAQHILTMRGPCFGGSGCINQAKLIEQNTNNASEFIIVSDNQINAGDCRIAIRQQPTDANSNEVVRNVINERNWIRLTHGAQSLYPIGLEAFKITVRNNIADVTGANEHGVVGIEDLSNGLVPPPDSIWVYNNSTISRDVDSDFAVVRGDFAKPAGAMQGTPTNIYIRNNLAYAVSDTLHLMVNGTVTGGTTSNNSTESAGGQIDVTNPYISSVAAVPADFQITTGSYAIGTGVVLPLYDDFFCNRRSATFDMGAHAFNVGP